MRDLPPYDCSRDGECCGEPSITNTTRENLPEGAVICGYYDTDGKFVPTSALLPDGRSVEFPPRGSEEWN